MPRLHVTVTDGRGRPTRRYGLEAWLPSAAPAAARGTVAIALVSDAAMRTLNRRYRQVDRPTDVLSFPAESPGHLGDLAIALGVARRQAHAHGHPIQTELRILALHGLLHLLGYDHGVDRGQMRRIEERLRRRAGLPSGLIRRGAEQAWGPPSGGPQRVRLRPDPTYTRP